MKKQLKIAICLFSIGVFSGFPMAFANSGDVREDSKVISNRISEDIIHGDIKKSEKITINEKRFEKGLNESGYKYIKVSKNTSFTDELTKKVIATINVDANFRCNEEKRQAVCLSTIRNSFLNDSDYILNSSLRCANKNTENGCAVANFSLAAAGYTSSFSRETIDSENYEINCDYQGNISFKNLEK